MSAQDGSTHGFGAVTIKLGPVWCCSAAAFGSPAGPCHRFAVRVLLRVQGRAELDAS